MVHTLLTFTPLQDAKEDTGQKDLLNCVALTQTLGPMPLASLDSNGWVIWEHKIMLVDGHLIQIAPVVDNRVLAPTHCFDIQGHQQAIRLTITRDSQNSALFYIQLDPIGSVPVSTLNNSVRISSNPTQFQPVPSLQVVSVRDKYLTSDQTFALGFIGTTDTRMGRSTKIYFGNMINIWAETNAVMVEWPAA